MWRTNSKKTRGFDERTGQPLSSTRTIEEEETETETALSVEEEQDMNNLIVEAELAAEILNQDDNQPCTGDKTQCARDKIKKMYKKFKAAITPIEGTAKFSAHFVAFLLTNKLFENMFHKKLSRMSINACTKFTKRTSSDYFKKIEIYEFKVGLHKRKFLAIRQKAR